MKEVNNSFNDAWSLLLLFEDLALLDDSIELGTLNLSLYNNLVLAGDNTNLKTASVRLASCIHAFAKDFDSEDKCLLKSAFRLIIVLESIGSILTSFASGISFPGSVVTGRIRCVKLEPLDLVKSSVHEGDSERSASTVLSETVFVVSSVLDELLDHNRALLLVIVSLSVDTAVIN
jgi:hypothetical protein